MAAQGRRMMARVGAVVMFAGLITAGIGSSAQAYTKSYAVSVDSRSGSYEEEGGAVGYAWRNLSLSVDGDVVKAAFDLKVWNNVRTPITQVFVCVNSKVYACVLNRVPSASSRESYNRYSVSFRVNYPSENAHHGIYLIQTQAMGEEAGRNHVEVEGGGWKSRVGTLTTR